MPRHGRHPAQLLAATIILGSLAAAHAQQAMPFQGRGSLPPGQDVVDVYVSAFVDRLLEVDEQKYRFKATIFYYLSWVDARTKSEVIKTTNSSLNNPTYNGGQGCKMPCQSHANIEQGGCCDTVFLPHIAHTNIFGLSQDRTIRYGVGYDPREEGNDSVYWWISLNAEYYTPMYLRAFPFDTQTLQIQMEVPQSRFGWSGGSTRFWPSVSGSHMFAPEGTGDDNSAWSITSVSLTPYSYSMCDPFFRFSSLTGGSPVSNTSDPSPLVPAFDYDDPSTVADYCDDYIGRTADPQGSPLWARTLAGTTKNTVQIEGINISIEIKRHSNAYLVTMILPIVLTVFMANLIYFVSPNELEVRLGAVVALFLALTAVQFVVSQSMPASSYVTAMGELIIFSYVVLIFDGMETILVYNLSKFCERRERKKQQKRAVKSWWKPGSQETTPADMGLPEEKLPMKYAEEASSSPVRRLGLVRSVSRQMTRPFANFYKELHTNQPFADYFASRLDTCLAVFRFFAVLIITILIFVINKKMYGEINS